MSKQLHRLTRVVRFSVNPFLDETPAGGNSYSAKPSGEGLAIYFSLEVELSGEVDPQTGFVINLTEIDKNVRTYAVPIFDATIRESYRKLQHIDFRQTINLLAQAFGTLGGKFASAKVERMALFLNPFRKIEIYSQESEVIYYSEKFEFAAMHKLWNESFSEEKNHDVFGKCANPAGHGHNYIVEVQVALGKGEEFSYGNFQRIVDENFISLLDHKNLNIDVAYFKDKITTVENITTFGWEKLAGKLAGAKLNKLTIWENDRAFCTYRGE